MPFVVVCPECNAQLKSNALVPAGKMIVCPSCKAKFTTEADSKEVGGGGSKASVNVPPAPPPTPPKPKAKPSREDEEEEDDRPKKKVKASRDDDDGDDPFAEMDDDKPKKKAKASRDDDEEDERPSKKKAKASRNDDDEDEDERPSKKSKKKSRDDDEEDDDFDDEDRPSKKGKKGKKGKKKSNLPLILGGVAVLLFFCAGAGVLGIIFYSDIMGALGLGGGSQSSMAKYAPPDTEVMRYTNVKSSRAFSEKNPDLKGSFFNKQQMSTFAPLAPEDVDEFAEFSSRSTTGFGNSTEVYKLNKEVTLDSLKGKAKGIDGELEGKKYYKVGPRGVYMPDSKTVVVASDAHIQKLIKEGKGGASDKFLSHVGKYSGDRVELDTAPKSSMSIATPGGNGIGGTPPEFSVVTYNFSGDSVEVSGKAEFKSSDVASAEATRLNKQLEDTRKGLDMLKGLAGGKSGKSQDDIDKLVAAIEKAKVSQSGSTVTSSAVLPAKLLFK